MKILMLSLFLSLMATKAWGAWECSIYKNEHESEVSSAPNLVFFASWCQACVASIKEADPEKDVFIAVFDQKKRAEEALLYILGKDKNPVCFWDEGSVLAKKYGVSTLPNTVSKTK